MKSTPPFCSISPEAVEIWLTAGLDDLDLVNRFHDDMPLLHFCIQRRLPLTRTILTHLKHQVTIRWKGSTPLEYGKF